MWLAAQCQLGVGKMYISVHIVLCGSVRVRLLRAQPLFLARRLRHDLAQTSSECCCISVAVLMFRDVASFGSNRKGTSA